MKLPPGYVPGVGTHKPTAKGGFGERLLKQFGWKEGRGLGAKEDGMAEALKVKQKKDNTGVGAHNSAMWRDKWWEDAFAQSIANVNGIHEAGLREGSSSDSDSSDSDDSTAEVPADMHADGTRSSATAAELALAKQLAKDPWGRFGGRQGKIARLRAAEVALVAESRSAAPPATQQTAPSTDAAAPANKKGRRKKRGSEEADAGAADATPASNAAPKAKRKKGAAKALEAAASDAAEGSAGAAAAPKRLLIVKTPAAVLEAEARMAAALAAFQPTPLTGWWGAKRFISVGALGSTLESKPQDKERKAFTEDTQEAAYMALHNAKTSGKKGLGKVAGSGGPIGGAMWEGNKVTFDDDEQPAAAAADSNAAAASMESAQTAYESPAEEGPSSPVAPAPAKAFPYRKVVRSLLQQADGQALTVKQLSKQIRQQWTAKSSKYGPVPAAAELKAGLSAKLERIKGVAVEGKRVTIAA